MPDRKYRFLLILGCLSAILVGGWLRGLMLLDRPDSVWLDELHTAWVVSGDWQDIGPRARIGNQSPLFFCLEFLATKTGTLNSFRLRLAPFLFGCASLVLVSRLTWVLTRSKLGVFSATCCASLESSLIYYSVEARPYAAVQLVALLQILFFWKYFFGDSNRRLSAGLALTGLNAVLFYLHYTSAAFIIAEYLALFLLINFPARLREASQLRVAQVSEGALAFTPAKTLKSSAIQLASMVLIGLPGALHLLNISQGSSDWSSFAGATEFMTQLRPLWLSYFLVPAILLSVFWIEQNLVRREPAFMPGMSASLKWLFTVTWAPIAVFLLVSWLPSPTGQGSFLPLGHLRYAACSLAVMPVGIGIVVANCRHAWKRLVSTLLLVLVTILFNPVIESLVKQEPLPDWKNENWLVVAEQIDRHPSVPVLLFANLIEDHRLAEEESGPEFQAYCRFALDNRLVKITNPQRLTAMPTWRQNRFSQKVLGQLLEQRTIIIVIRGDESLSQDILIDLESQLAIHDRRIGSIKIIADGGSVIGLKLDLQRMVVPSTKN